MNIKSNDKELIKRLLIYAKPYIGYITLSLLLLIGVIFAELLRPILIGNAVDNVITNYDKNYEIVDSEEIGAINLQNYYLIETDTFDEKNLYAKLIYDEKTQKYYLLPEITFYDVNQLNNEDLNIINKGDSYYIKINNSEKQISLLSETELKKIRDLDIHKLINITILFFAVLIIGLILSYIQTIILHYVGQKIIYNIRNEIFSHIQTLSINFFNNNPVGKLVTRITNDTETLNEMYTSVIVNSVKNILLLVGISVMMFILNFELTLVIFLVVPLILLSSFLFRKYSIEAYREVRTRVAAINTFLSEHISGMSIVQIFNQEKRKFEEFNASNAKLKKSNIKQLIIFSIYRPTIYLLYILSLTIVLGYGGNKVLKGAMSVGTLIIFIQYISDFFNPIQQLAEQYNILQSAMASAEKIFSILDEKDQIKNGEKAIRLKKVRGTIEFKNVWFSYDDKEWVLKDVSFKVNPGETVAFVGATGAGKTSILNLISRYYDVQKGEILLDGINIKDYDIKSLRSHIGQMLQDVFIFNGTIKSNIRLKNEEITDEEIIKSAEYVNASKFIDLLPNKYNEKVYERGATFSAGQRQLLSFARTLTFKPSILILDEATSNIDTETERLIQDALIKLMKGRTTLVVAHRLSTIQHADKIIVLHKGRIKEIGKHQELLANRGLYYNLYKLQYQEIY